MTGPGNNKRVALPEGPFESTEKVMDSSEDYYRNNANEIHVWIPKDTEGFTALTTLDITLNELRSSNVPIDLFECWIDWKPTQPVKWASRRREEGSVECAVERPMIIRKIEPMEGIEEVEARPHADGKTTVVRATMGVSAPTIRMKFEVPNVFFDLSERAPFDRKRLTLNIRVKNGANSSVLQLTYPSSMAMRARADNSEYHSLVLSPGEDGYYRKATFFPQKEINVRYTFGTSAGPELVAPGLPPLRAGLALLGVGLALLLFQVGLGEKSSGYPRFYLAEAVFALSLVPTFIEGFRIRRLLSPRSVMIGEKLSWDGISTIMFGFIHSTAMIVTAIVLVSDSSVLGSVASGFLLALGAVLIVGTCGVVRTIVSYSLQYGLVQAFVMIVVASILMWSSDAGLPFLGAHFPSSLFPSSLLVLGAVLILQIAQSARPFISRYFARYLIGPLVVLIAGIMFYYVLGGLAEVLAAFASVSDSSGAGPLLPSSLFPSSLLVLGAVLIIWTIVYFALLIFFGTYQKYMCDRCEEPIWMRTRISERLERISRKDPQGKRKWSYFWKILHPSRREVRSTHNNTRHALCSACHDDVSKEHLEYKLPKHTSLQPGDECPSDRHTDDPNLDLASIEVRAWKTVLGCDVRVERLPEFVDADVRRWLEQDLGLRLRYIPSLDHDTIDNEVKEEYRILRDLFEKSGFKPPELSGKWVAVETKDSPEQSNNHPIREHIKGFGSSDNGLRTSWSTVNAAIDKVRELVLPTIRRSGGQAEVRLLDASEWNLLAYRERWGETNMYEWTNNEFVRLGYKRKVVVGKSDGGDAHCVHTRSPVNCDNLGFRAAIVLEP